MIKWKNVIAAGMILSLGALLLMGCGKKDAVADNDDDDDWVVVGKDSEEPAPATESGTEVVSEDTTEDTESNSVFSEMAKYSYTFASGAGAWSTELTVNEDGSFEGSYSDADMGDTGTDYPNGIVYLCDFSGKFSTPEKVDEYTYKTTIKSMNYLNKTDGEDIVDGVKYIYSGAYGLDGAKTIYFYMKGAPIDQLPKEYVNWISLSLEDGQTELSWCGIYNEAAEAGFYGWTKSGSSESNASAEKEEQDGISAELAGIEKKAKRLQEKLQSGDLTQGEMNQLSAKLYKLWDDELNDIWGRLDEDTKSGLLQEERDWIKEKEKKIKEAGKEWEGGSGQPLAENQEGADLTRDRVYKLADYLR